MSTTKRTALVAGAAGVAGSYMQTPIKSPKNGLTLLG
jgi:hypothetical protein